MKVQERQNSIVIPGNSQQHCQATRTTFLRWRSQLKQPVDPVISSGKQHDCDGRQRLSICQGEVRAIEAASTWDRSTPSATSDPVDPEDRQCYSMLRDELILKNLFGRLVYTQHPSQQQDHEDIPGNVFFEWVGKARISEKNLINIQHFRALARFNGINVRVLVDKPITVVATEARTDTVTGRIETITVARLYQDFRAALKEAGHPDADRIFTAFVKRTEQHRIGLCNHALRSDYFRLALLYTYGGMHSDVAVSLEGFDKERGSVEFPLIPLKGKNGFLIRSFDQVLCSSDDNKTIKIRKHISSTLMASSRQNQIVLFMLICMFNVECSLECLSISGTGAETVFCQSCRINEHDVMRLPRCSIKQIVRVFGYCAKEKYREEYPRIALQLKLPEELVINAHITLEALSLLEKPDCNKTKEDISRRHPGVMEIAAAGLRNIWSFCGPDKLYKTNDDLVTESRFPFPEKAPAIANMKPVHSRGDGSWYKGLSNPRYVEDTDIEYHEYSETSHHDRGKAEHAIVPWCCGFRYHRSSTMLTNLHHRRVIIEPDV